MRQNTSEVDFEGTLVLEQLAAIGELDAGDTSARDAFLRADEPERSLRRRCRWEARHGVDPSGGLERDPEHEGRVEQQEDPAFSSR